eukprot:7326220-Alexandrium_andersonii.AAC.1
MPLQEGKQLKPEYAGYTRVPVGVGSRAAASAMPEWLLGNRRVLESKGSRKGARYPAADGGRIRDLGEVHLGIHAQEQHRCRITFQVAEVERPLLAVSTLAKAGYDVYFASSGGKVVNRKSQRTINFFK